MMRGLPGRSRRTPRTSGPRRIGRSARSSPPPDGRSPAPNRTAPSGRRSRRARARSRCAITASTSTASRRRRRAPAAADGSDPARPVVLLSVGRAVEKKGYDDLLAALALLPPDLAWRFVHIGGGPLAKRLRSAGDPARSRRPHRVARRPAAAGGARRLPRGRPVRARRQDRPRRRPRRPAQRADGGAEPGPACVATRLPGIPELIATAHRRPGPARRSAGARGRAGGADPRPGAARMRSAAAGEERVAPRVRHASAASPTWRRSSACRRRSRSDRRRSPRWLSSNAGEHRRTCGSRSTRR